VREYFNRVRSGDLHGLLDLFSDDCVVHEPFSSSKFLTGKIEIEPFFRSAIMANQGVQYEIKIEKERHKTVGNSMVAVVFFRKENEIKGKFTFEFEDVIGAKFARIRTLIIEFVD
jgi:ketosteroid isomerase-like protein